MDSSLQSFVQSRQSSITQHRIRQILSYVLECQKIFQSEGVIYSESVVKASGTVMFEDHLKFEFVEKYLVKYKPLLKGKISELEEINFACETQQRYIDATDNRQKPDKIDIYINKIGLRNLYSHVEDENIYFAIECKRIKVLSDSRDYVTDIEKKFVKRQHINLRLPFEGQIAFIENNRLNHIIISKEINRILSITPSIPTVASLTPERLHSTIQGTYVSKHKRNRTNLPFLIYHLMFDYSKVVI
jgi:hypothetical protein